MKSLRFQSAPWLFIAPFLALFLLFTAWPLLHSLLLAMEQTYGPQTMVWVGLKNFRYLVSDPLFWLATWNTLLYTLGSLVIQLPVALGLALLLNRPGLRGRGALRLIFFSPSLVGLAFAAMLFVPIFQQRTGLLNVLLHRLFPVWDPAFPWLEHYIVPALILASVWLYAGFNMIYFLAALQNVPRDLLEAAEIDGAGPWPRFRHVTLPAIAPIAGFVALISVIGSFQIFELSYILLGGPGPANRGLTIVMYLYDTGFATGDLGYASAIGWVLAVFLIVIALIQRRLSRRYEEL